MRSRLQLPLDRNQSALSVADRFGSCFGQLVRSGRFESGDQLAFCGVSVVLGRHASTVVIIHGSLNS